MSQTTDQINAAVDSLWAGVVSQQNHYHAQHGENYQMLWTHSQVPFSPTEPDAILDRPTDQPAAPINGLPRLMRSRMRIDTYGKPDGWTMTLQASIDGQIWQRSIDCGVDPSRSSDWQVLPPSP